MSKIGTAVLEELEQANAEEMSELEEYGADTITVPQVESQIRKVFIAPQWVTKQSNQEIAEEFQRECYTHGATLISETDKAQLWRTVQGKFLEFWVPKFWVTDSEFKKVVSDGR